MSPYPIVEAVSLGEAARPSAAQSRPFPTLPDAVAASCSPRFEPRPGETSVELGYGCVDWFIYGTDARAGCATLGR